MDMVRVASGQAADRNRARMAQNRLPLSGSDMALTIIWGRVLSRMRWGRGNWQLV